MKARSSLLWPVPALAALLMTVVADVTVGEDVILTGAYAIPVLALALVARPPQVVATAVLAVALAIGSGAWNDYLLDADHVVRLSLVSVASVLAVLSARARAGADEERRRMAVLAEVARITDAPTVARALERLGHATVPAVAERVWVDLAEDGERRRALDAGAGEGGDEVVVPLRVRDQEIGAVGFAARRYDARDRAFFRVLAGRVALALANVRLLDEVTRTRERLDRILGSLGEAVTVHDAEGQTIYANDAARELLGVAAEEAPVPARPGALAARFIITHEDGTPVRVEEFPGRRLMAGEPDPPPLLTRSVRRDTGREYWLLTKATLLRDADGAPLAANVIEDVTEAKDSELRQRFLDQAGQVLASSLDYEQALRRVCELAVPWLADWAAIDVAAERGIERVAIAHADPEKLAFAEELARRYTPDPDAPAGVPAVLRTGRAERYDEIDDEVLERSARDAEHLELIRRVGMRAALVVPMAAGDEVLGAITLVSAESARTFDDDDFAFAQDLARRAATAVQNGRLYAQQMRVAVTLQRSLLPERLPAVPGWEAAASYESGDASTEVGGDFYDVVPTPQGHLVILGDVTGKGVEAAALTALVRHSAQMAARFDSRPSKVLALVNAVLREQARLSPVSVVCALVEPGRTSPCVTVAAAGHPLPLLKRPGDDPREVGRHDVLLGVVERDAFAEETLEVRPGDVLLFFTDGVLDAPGGEGRFGEDRLREAVAAAAADPFALLRAIETALRSFGRADGADDRAMLALRYVGAPARDEAAPPLSGARA